MLIKGWQEVLTTNALFYPPLAFFCAGARYEGKANMS